MKPCSTPSAMRRRGFVGTLLRAGAGAAALGQPRLWAAAGKKVTPADAFDPVIEAFMAERKVPGGALAVVKNGRIVYARGYGWADRERKIPARPDSLFRIASISKPFTAVAVLRLVEQKRLRLEAKALELVTLPPVLEAGQTPEPRLRNITVAQLLQHTAGWDREKSFDPMFRPVEIARKVGVPPPAGPEAVVRYMLGRPLDFDPGARYAYSNFGYCLLGRIIEKMTGQPYEQFVRETVLARIGIRRMRIGASLDEPALPHSKGRRADGEVRYYTRDNEQADSVFPGPTKVPLPYGGFHLEAMDAHGGWIASALDLARFAAALDNPAHSPLLRPETFKLLYAPPQPPASRLPDGSLEDHYYACGWMVRPIAGQGGKANYWHSGSLPGTATLLVRRWDGLSWAVLFNQRSEDKKLPDSAIDPALHQAADQWVD